MKVHYLLSAALWFTLALSATSAPNELTADEKTAGWKLLFDGKSTTSWKSFNKDNFPASGWTVEDGALHCTSSGGRPNSGGGDIITRETFSDFELTWEWKISPGGNSGVKYLIAPRAANSGSMFKGDDGKALVGFEYQLIDDTTHPDAKKSPIRTTGALYQLIEPAPTKTLRQAGEWNTSRIVVHGNHIEHWLNGTKTVETEIGSPKLQAAIAASKYNKIPGFGAKSSTPILLQDHGDAVWFRSIKIRPFNPAAQPIKNVRG